MIICISKYCAQDHISMVISKAPFFVSFKDMKLKAMAGISKSIWKNKVK
jgi:hypothetical protein